MSHIKVLDALAIPAAGTSVLSNVFVISYPEVVGHINAQFLFDYGSGGTSVAAYLQTSLDSGTTWIDIACAKFLLADATKLFSVNASGTLTAATAPKDATLTDDTVLDGVIGDRFRIKAVVVGTYAASTLSVDLQVTP